MVKSELIAGGRGGHWTVVELLGSGRGSWVSQKHGGRDKKSIFFGAFISEVTGSTKLQTSLH